MDKPTNILAGTVADSPAEHLGILEGDEIIAINNIPTETWDEIADTISRSDPNQELEIRLIRDGKEEIFL